ncbi:glycosyltransferase [Pseudomonas sp.]|uniref:glycosyltransferase n=1 Tax=Pseudomonas sp. TaxID=306 RepID=UPI0028B17106|nr:glycosyltransferase [Pseudomonas sp.]
MIMKVEDGKFVDRPRFAVLLAAHNGVAWLPEQVESIQKQVDVDVTIHASVDRSQDGTEKWLKDYEQRHSSLRLLPSGIFGGAAKNFFRLIRDVDISKYDYVAFSDQDDIWDPEKLISAYQVLSSGVAKAYSANVTAFWVGGRQKLIDKASAQKKYDHLFEAAGPGCTYVLSRDVALDFKDFLLRNWPSISAVALHDWLIYAWVRSAGWVWYIDRRSVLNYRQHGTNQMGANSGMKQLLRRLKLVHQGWYRDEVEKIITLLEAEKILPVASANFRSRRFLIGNISETRRRGRDRLFLLALLLFNIY